MPRLVWNQVGQRFYESGVSQGVLYPRVGNGVPWNGLVSVSEKNSGEPTSYYYDGVKYLDLVAAEDFEATIEAFSAPPEFAECDGSKQLANGLFATQQPRAMFGFCYRTGLGNDEKGLTLGYKLHLVYNATAAPSAQTNRTTGANVDPSTRSWDIVTVPVPTSTYKPTSHLVVDSTKTTLAKLTALENQLYGTAGTNPLLPTQAAVIALLA